MVCSKSDMVVTRAVCVLLGARAHPGGGEGGEGGGAPDARGAGARLLLHGAHGRLPGVGAAAGEDHDAGTSATAHHDCSYKNLDLGFVSRFFA